MSLQSPHDDVQAAGNSMETASSAPAPTTISPVLRRSTRIRRQPDRLGFCAYFTSYMCQCLNIFRASASDPDTLNSDEAMSEDPDCWNAAASREIQELEEKNTWEEVSQSKALIRILPSTWVFRKKRLPDGTLRKYKARFCVRGDLQDRSNLETYAPVVSTSSIRVFLILSVTLTWQTCSNDFQNAFVQSDLESPIWIHIPRGFTSRQPNTCLKLKKSLYCLVNAPRLWYDHLLEFLLTDGFTQSKPDKCFFYRDDIFLILHVDDTGIAFRSNDVLESFLERLSAAGFKFSREGTIHEFLGITFTTCATSGSVTLTQTGLIGKIISATGLDNANPSNTPAYLQALGKDPTGTSFNKSWSYSSVVGMLLYLATHTRPDISFAVSQVARFVHSPKHCHGVALKRIVRYLVGTRNQGITYQATISLALNAYADADFCGLYRSDPSSDRSSARSRSGYIIFLGPCPLLWRSFLQSEVALSTLESEYYALSQCLRVLLPLRTLVMEVAELLHLGESVRATINCNLYEDNTGAISLAVTQQITPRTKHFHVKFHHFWDNVTKKHVYIIYIKSHDNRADYFTKALPRETFERLCRIVQGW